MIYQNDTYTFTLSLTRPDVSVVAISAVTVNSDNVTYSYTLLSGPSLHLGTNITITGLSDSGNNGTFEMQDLSPNEGILVNNVPVGYASFTVTNDNGVEAVESGTGIVSTIPNVTVSPILQIVQLSTLTAMLTTPASMTSLDSSNQLWLYTWSIGAITNGEYAAIVSYVADGITMNSIMLEKIQVGDSNILGTVALNATVVKDSTVAKDATVAHITDLATINPNTSSVVLAIKSSTDNLPSDPAGMTLLATTIQNIEDIHDASLGNQSVD